MVLRHLPIDGHPRPVELLGGLADIPIGGNEDRQQRKLVILRKVLDLAEPPAVLLGQVLEGDLPVAEVGDRSL